MIHNRQAHPKIETQRDVLLKLRATKYCRHTKGGVQSDIWVRLRAVSTQPQQQAALMISELYFIHTKQHSHSSPRVSVCSGSGDFCVMAYTLHRHLSVHAFSLSLPLLAKKKYIFLVGTRCIEWSHNLTDATAAGCTIGETLALSAEHVYFCFGHLTGK